MAATTTSSTSTGKTPLLILELEGLYPDTVLEDAIFASQSPRPHNYDVTFIRANLSPGGDGESLPLSSLSDELCRKVDGLMVFRHYLPREQINRFPNLKVVVRMGVGYDRLDRVTLAERGVTVCNVPDYGTNDVADHALALALSLRRGILLHHELQRKDGCAWQISLSPLVSRITNQTFAILGLGRMGIAAALRAKAFGWKVIFYDPYLSNGVDKALQVERVDTLEELFTRGNVLSIHCPHTRETRGMVGDSLLSLLPSGSILVNTARGEIVDLDAVERALRKGNLAGAGLDVLPEEPIPEPAPSLIQAYRRKEPWLEGRLVITPHSAFYSPESFQDIREFSAKTIREVLIDGLKTNEILPTTE